MTNEPDIRLNPDLDVKALKRAFAEEKRLHIPEILAPDAAERLHQCLAGEIAWNLTFNDERGPQNIFASKMQDLTPQDWQKIRQKVMQNAREGNFQYFYGNFAVEDAYKENLIQDMYVARFFEFVNSDPFLSFIRDITGMEEICYADQQATAYGPGHFLTEHNDFDPKIGRKVAYVFNLTPKWRAEWGGILQFLEKSGKKISGFVPTFNALNIFAVPEKHIVSQVAPFAPAVRYSITGWFLDKKDD